MNRTRLTGVIGLLLFAATVACHPAAKAKPIADAKRATAAARLTKWYAQSRFAQWNVQAQPAGRDCAVLLIETSVLMTNEMVETVQFGAGSSEIYEGGAQRYSRDNGFRGVAYRDAGDRTWAYVISDQEAESARPCR